MEGEGERKKKGGRERVGRMPFYLFISSRRKASACLPTISLATLDSLKKGGEREKKKGDLQQPSSPKKGNLILPSARIEKKRELCASFFFYGGVKGRGRKERLPCYYSF